MNPSPYQLEDPTWRVFAASGRLEGSGLAIHRNTRPNQVWWAAGRVPFADFDFANNRGLQDTITGRIPAGFTFTRASAASYVDQDGMIRSVGNDIPRLAWDPTTGRCAGVPVEPTGGNSASRSEEFNNAAYVGVSGSITGVNAGIAPDGTQTADELTSTGGGVYRSVALAANYYGLSVFVKYISGGAATFDFGTDTNPANGRTIFDLAAGAVSSNGANVITSNIQAYPNGWYRCYVKVLATANPFNVVFYGPTSGTILQLWGFQVENNASEQLTASNYMATTTSTATRSSESLQILSYGSQIRAAYIECLTQVGASTTRPLVSFDNNTANNRIELAIAGGAPNLLVTTSGSTQANLNSGSVSSRQILRLAARFDRNNFAVSANGAMETTGGAGVLPPVTRMRIGANQATNSNYEFMVSRIVLWNTPIPMLHNLTR